MIAAGSQCAVAQTTVPQGVDQTPTRVLQVDQVLGAVSVQRDGRIEELQPGFLVFNRERVLLTSRARADLALSRYGEIDIASSGAGPGALSFEKLPFSSWAVDLETRMRLERGLLRVRWARASEAQDWPVSVVIDQWSAQLGNGEFLFRRDERGILVCNVAGSIEISDEPAGQRQTLKPNSCARMGPGESAQNAKLEGSDWSELQVAILPSEPGESFSNSRNLPSAAGPPVSSSARIPIDTPPLPAPPSSADPVAIAQTAPTIGSVPGPADPEQVAAAAPAAAPDLGLPESTPVVKAPTPAPAAAPVAPPPVEMKPGEKIPAAAQNAPPVEAPAPAAAAAPSGKAPTPPPASDARAPSAPPVSMRPLAQADIPVVAPGTTMVAKAPPVTMPVTAGAPPTAPTGPEWIVNVMTVTDPDVAKQHLATLTEAGYPASLRTEMVRGRASYRVIIGGIGNEQGARRTAQLLASKMGYTAAWPLQKR